MEDVTLSNFSWRKPIKTDGKIILANKEAQTTEIATKSVECTAKFIDEKECQTDDTVSTQVSNNGYRISDQVLKILEDFINDDSEVNYDRLLEFHKFDTVALETVHSYHVETRNEPIISMRSNSTRKTLILFGGTYHDTFCSHQARAMLCSSSTTFSLPLPVCALTSTFINSTHYVLGDISGNLSMCRGDEKVFGVKASDGAITCIEMSKHGLIVGSDDGTLQLWTIVKGGFEKQSSIKLVVSDLPRKIRKSSSSSRPVAVVSIQVCSDECCVATETGGIYIVSLPSLDYKPVSISSSSSIKCILFESPYIAVSYHNTSTVIMTSERTIDQLSMIASISVRCGKYFVFSDHRRLLLWSCNTQLVVVDNPIECQAVSSISTDSIQILDASNNLTTMLINDR